MKPVILIPTYNERENLPELIDKIRAHTTQAHIIVIDDNSTDGTGDIAEEIAANDGAMRVLRRPQKDGLGRAYTSALKLVFEEDYDVVVQMDGDLSHDPGCLPIFLREIQSCDLVIGSRYLHGSSVVNWDLKRLVLSKLANQYVRFTTGMPFTDATSGFNCWRREKLETIDFNRVVANGYLFLIELKYHAFRKGFKTVELPIVFTERKLGKSKLSWGIMWEALVGVLRLRFRRRNSEL